jgi:uncharacterized protein YjbI with pentapeptide repeats/energy-coupling factor transporter ATP-binding protein EcfA2
VVNNTSIKTILILAANPKTTSRLRLDEEIREIEQGLKNSERFRLVQKWAVRQRDFYRAILEHKPQIIHFCGHGTGDGGIVLENEIGQSVSMGTEALSRLFKLFAVLGVECVVFNACYSEVQAKAVSQYIKYVVGMNKAIGDKAAIDFAVAFYDGLDSGKNYQFAYELGCSLLVNSKEDSTPVLKITEIYPEDIQFVPGDIPPNPYLGLSAFAEKDAEFFFGREEFTNELFSMAHQQNLVAVIGASGSGKSSVVFAGLIPKLREKGTWLIESLRPKSQPFDELALALVRQLEPNLYGIEKTIKVGKLAESLNKGEVKLHQVASQILEDKPNKCFLLVVDQFEELYTQCQDKEQQQSFIDTLLLAINQKSITLVFTLRADFYGYVLSYRAFGDALQQIAFKPLNLMSRKELQTAIERPTEKLGVKLQTHLAERILNDVGQEPGNLPLLEFALTRLWDKQKNNELTHQAYDEIGGIKQALVKHTEEVYKKLNKAQQQQAQRIFLSLVRLGETTEDTRRVADRKEIGNQNWDLVRYLAGSETRLVVTGREDASEEETVEVIHEALIREWETLRKWVNENREKLIQKRKIETAAVEWKEKNKPKGYLLQGRQLQDAQVFQKQQNISLTLSDLATDFIQKSVKHKRNSLFMLINFVFIPVIFLTFVGYREVRISYLRDVVREAQGQKVNNARFNALEQLVKLGASVKRINLSGADLSGADLSGADFSGADFSGADFSGADLSSADLSSANFHKANLPKANFHKANLKGANLYKVNFYEVNLRGAYLYKANFHKAKLRGANFKNANLRGAKFWDKELDRKAENITPEQIKQAKNWEEAVYSPEFRKKLGLSPEE